SIRRERHHDPLGQPLAESPADEAATLQAVQAAAARADPPVALAILEDETHRVVRQAGARGEVAPPAVGRETEEARVVRADPHGAGGILLQAPETGRHPAGPRLEHQPA